ncbi:MAG: hypothetical protein WA040_06875 [Anaerolineae bacterium]
MENKPIGCLLAFLALLGFLFTVLAVVIAFLTWVNPQGTTKVLLQFVDTPPPVIVEVTIVATPTPGPTQTPVIESVEQVVTRVVEVTQVVPVEVTRQVIVTATPTYTPEVNPAAIALEDDFSVLNTSRWDIQSGNWQADSGKLSLPYNRSAPEAGHVLAGFNDWDNYVIEANVSGLFDYPIGDSQLLINVQCFFDVPASRDGYSSDIMNGVPKIRSRDGTPWTSNVSGCTPGKWTSRAAVLVGVDNVGPMAGLIIGENYMGWGVLNGDSWNTDPARFVSAPGSSGANLRIEVNGVEYKVYVNGQRVPELDYVDVGSSGGRFGLWARNATDRYNDFIEDENDWRLTPRFDYVRIAPLNGGE